MGRNAARKGAVSNKGTGRSQRRGGRPRVGGAAGGTSDDKPEVKKVAPEKVVKAGGSGAAAAAETGPTKPLTAIERVQLGGLAKDAETAATSINVGTRFFGVDKSKSYSRPEETKYVLNVVLSPKSQRTGAIGVAAPGKKAWSEAAGKAETRTIRAMQSRMEKRKVSSDNYKITRLSSTGAGVGVRMEIAKGIGKTSEPRKAAATPSKRTVAKQVVRKSAVVRRRRGKTTEVNGT
jgi:hypothetical protein